MKTKLMMVIGLGMLLAMAATSFAQSGENLLPFRQLYASATAPSNGANAVQTVTFGAVTGGTFTLTFEGRTTSAIAWSATNATLVGNMQTALQALPGLGNGGPTVAVGTIVAGANGTVLVTFSGNRAKQPVGTMTANSANLTGGTITSVTTTTAGVTADGRIYPRGALVCALDTGKWYTNSGSPPNPTWSIITSTP